MSARVVQLHYVRLALLPRDVVLVVGKRGHGKSWRVMNLIATLARVVMWDPNGEYSPGKGKHPPGYRPLEAISLAEFRRLVVHTDAGTRGDLRVAVQDSSVTDKDRTAAFAAFVGLVELCRDLVCGVDEADDLPLGAQAWLRHLARRSRHWRIPLILAGQRAYGIHKSARAQATHVISYRQDDPDDVAALAEIIGERALDIPNLSHFHSVDWMEQSS